MEALSRIYLKYVFHTFIDENKKIEKITTKELFFLQLQKTALMNSFIYSLNNYLFNWNKVKESL